MDYTGSDYMGKKEEPAIRSTNTTGIRGHCESPTSIPAYDMNHSTMIRTAIAVGFLAVIAQADKPNILLVLSDDHSFPHVGANTVM